jgi:hypothetical protein
MQVNPHAGALYGSPLVIARRSIQKASEGRAHPSAEFLDSYVRAREVQADTLIDDILEIADDSMNDWVERENARTGQTYIALNDEAIARAKLGSKRGSTSLNVSTPRSTVRRRKRHSRAIRKTRLFHRLT